MKKLVEQRRREKQEEKMARQKVREKIEQDKRDRAAKVGVISFLTNTPFRYHCKGVPQNRYNSSA